MGKTGSKKDVDVKTKIVFKEVSKEVGENEDKHVFGLSFDPWTERFDLKKDRKMLISSVSLRDCVIAAERHGVRFSEDETKITFKAIKED